MSSSTLSPGRDGPSGEEREARQVGPGARRADGVFTGFDFAGPTSPSEQPARHHPDQGRRRGRQNGQTIALDYLGQVYDTKKPFDESYSKEPASFPIGVGPVIEGWDEALVGQDRRQPRRSWRSRRPTATAEGQPARRDQGHRHPVLRRRHPRRRLTGGAEARRGEPMAARRPSACSTCYIMLLGADALRPQVRSARSLREYPDTAGRRGLREGVRADKEDLREPRRPGRGRLARRATSRTSPATASARHILAAADRPRGRRGRRARARRAGLEHAPGPGHHRGAAQAHAAGVEIDPGRLDVVPPGLARRGARLRRVLGGHPQASRRRPSTTGAPARSAADPPAPAVGRGPLLRPLVRRRARPRPREERVFRLSRVQGEVPRPARPAAYDVPEGTDIRAVARRWCPLSRRRARCWCARRRLGLRRAAPRRGRRRRAGRLPGWDRLVAAAGRPRRRGARATAPTSSSRRPDAARPGVARLRGVWERRR